MLNVWSIIKYREENYILLRYNDNKTVSIARFNYEPTKENIELKIDEYYEDIINYEIKAEVPVMNIKTNLIKEIVFEWR